MKKILFIISFVFLILLSSCIDNTPKNNDFITIDYSGNITKTNEIINLEIQNTRNNSEDNNFEYEITYIARINPVIVDFPTKNVVVQANDIVIHDDRAYIAYNNAGEEIAGAIQIVNIANKENPEIILEVKFRYIQVTALYIDGDEIIFGGSLNPDFFGGNKSFVSKFSSNNPTQKDMMGNMTFLESFTTTSITKYDDFYYIAVGAKNGGIHKLNDNFEEINFFNYDDVRSVDSFSNGIYSLIGTYESDYDYGRLINPLNNNEINIGDYTSFEHKSTIQLFEKENGFHNEEVMAFLALAEQGFKMVQIGEGVEESERIIFEKSLDDLAPPEEGIIRALNSVSYDGGFAFLALGEYGFKVMRINGEIVYVDEDTGELVSTLDEFAEVVGIHKFDKDFYNTDKPYSFNHIEYKNILGEDNKEVNYLFAAAGNFGVNIYTLKHKNEYIYNPTDEEIIDKIYDVLEKSEYNKKHFYLDFKKDVNMTVTFIEANNGHKNEFGYMNYDKNNRTQTGEYFEIFENTSKQGEGGALVQGFSKSFDMKSSEDIVFYISRNREWYHSDWKLDDHRGPRRNIYHYAFYIDEDFNRIYIYVDTLNQAGENKYDRLIVSLSFEDDEEINNIVDVIEVSSF
jgi:hypothetical protein